MIHARLSAVHSCSSGPDPVTEVLHDLRLGASFYCRSELRAPWGLEIPRREGASFHFVAEGVCLLECASEPPLRLEQGDIVLLPHGRGHRIADAPGRSARNIHDLPHERLGPSAAVLRHGGDGPRALLICGGARFEGPAVSPIVELMPEVVHLRREEARPWLEPLLAAMAAEAVSPRPGTGTVMTRLADVLVVEVVRSWLESGAEARTGWLRALRDPQIGRALALVHRRAGERWTLESLSREAGMSRTVFSERFTAMLGLPAMQYLTRWRMQLARGLLHEEGLALGEVASRLGYDSEPSFSRAFKRHVGASPGAVRRAGRRRTHSGRGAAPAGEGADAGRRATHARPAGA
jgi:AraC-like DNA-binding protein